MIPKKAFKEGESWEMKPGTTGPSAVSKELSKTPNDMQLNETAATISGKLVDIVKRTKEEKEKGKPVSGKVEITFTAPVSQFSKDKGFVVEQGTLTVTLKGNGCIDGKVPDGHLVTVMALDIKGTIDGFKMDIQMKATEDRKTELLPPPPKK